LRFDLPAPTPKFTLLFQFKNQFSL
jgi:hypothetical protein